MELWVVGDRGHVAGPCESETAAEAARIWGAYIYEPERFEIVERGDADAQDR